MTESERTIDVPDGRLAVRDPAQGSPVVLLHAGIVDSRAWGPLTPHLLADAYRMIGLEAPQELAVLIAAFLAPLGPWR